MLVRNAQIDFDPTDYEVIERLETLPERHKKKVEELNKITDPVQQMKSYAQYLVEIIDSIFGADTVKKCGAKETSVRDLTTLLDECVTAAKRENFEYRQSLQAMVMKYDPNRAKRKNK